VKVFVVAGEASGDRLGADLLRGLRHLVPDVSFRGVAGPEMQSEGLGSLFDMSELSVMGLAEVLPKYFALKRRLDQTVSEVLAWSPDILITIDSPDFCLRVARAVRTADPRIRTCHYVAPSVWAWRAGRAKKMARYIDHVLALLPFEPPYMEAEGMACDFVGHPIAAQTPITSKQIAQFQADFNLDPARESLVILPGSRASEIKRLLPIFCEVLSQPCFAEFQLIFPTLPHLAPLLQAEIGALPQDKRLVTGSGHSAAAAAEERLVAYSAATSALAASGTVSLELAAAGTPMVIAYDMGLISRLVIGSMVKIDTVTLVNLVSETRAVPEFIGKDCKAKRIAPALQQILKAPSAQVQAIEATMTRLGRRDPDLRYRAARAVLTGLGRT
jgi:lipid-A-disaccharide synthase